MIKKISILGLFLVGILQLGVAQKFGHINSTQLLLELPSVKAADTQLESYQKQLIAKGQEMVATFQKSYQDYSKVAETGNMSKVKMQEVEAKLAQKQQAIQVYEQEVQQKLMKKRETLYQPILESLKNKLDELGKEGSYTMIFDSSSGGLLHAVESEDLMSKMKAKLGL